MRAIRSGLSIVVLVCAATAAYADPLTCTTTGYKSAAGLVAAVADNALTLTWDGERIKTPGAPVLLMQPNVFAERRPFSNIVKGGELQKPLFPNTAKSF